MTDYARVSLTARFSEQSDFSDRILDRFVEYEPSSPALYSDQVVSAALAGTTVDLGAFTTIKYLVVHNRDTTNFVTAVYRSAGGAAANQTQKILAGQLLLLPDVTPANDIVLSADTAICECEIIIVGA